MIILRDVKCQNWDEVCNYFDYPPVRDDICINKKGRVRDIVEKTMTTNGRKVMLLIIDNSESPGTLLQEDDYSKLFPEDKEPGKRGIDYEALSKFLSGLWDEANPIVETVKNATCEGAVKLTAKQAYEVLLFSVLFAFVQRKPESSDVKKLEDDLKLDKAQALSKMKNIPLITLETEFPSFQKYTKGTSFQLELVTIHNKTDETALVTLKDSPLRRHLKPDEKLLALMVDGQVAAFLPRICVSRGQALYREGNQLTTTCAGSSEQRKSDEIAFFSESEELGLLAADREGNWIPTRDLKLKPCGKIRWLRGAYQDYGFLYSDGSYEGLYDREAWKGKKLLAFDLSGGGKGVALTADRKAIDEEGHTLGENIAAVSCCWDKYILLGMDGSVVTDRGSPKLDSPVRAVCAHETGYWIATDEALMSMDEEGDLRPPHPYKLDEIERDNAGETVFGRQTDGVILPICLTWRRL